MHFAWENCLQPCVLKGSTGMVRRPVGFELHFCKESFNKENPSCFAGYRILESELPAWLRSLSDVENPCRFWAFAQFESKTRGLSGKCSDSFKVFVPHCTDIENRCQHMTHRGVQTGPRSSFTEACHSSGSLRGARRRRRFGGLLFAGVLWEVRSFSHLDTLGNS